MAPGGGIRRGRRSRRPGHWAWAQTPPQGQDRHGELPSPRRSRVVSRTHDSNPPHSGHAPGASADPSTGQPGCQSRSCRRRHASRPARAGTGDQRPRPCRSRLPGQAIPGRPCCDSQASQHPVGARASAASTQPDQAKQGDAHGASAGRAGTARGRGHRAPGLPRGLHSSKHKPPPREPSAAPDPEHPSPGYLCHARREKIQVGARGLP